MIKVIEVLLPVAVMIAIGVMCRKLKFLSDKGINELKFITTKILLPVAIFDALATNRFTKDSFVVIIIMLPALILSFGAGYLLKRFMKGTFQKYIPFMVSLYEGGMIAYPLYINIVGAEHLSNIALIDIAGLLFGFSVYMSMLVQTESGEKTTVKKICFDAIRNPSFVATVLGLIAGLSGVFIKLQESLMGGTYSGIINIITTPMSAIILIVVGYSFAPVKEMIAPCIKTIILRVILQACLIAVVIYATHLFIGKNMYMDIALITYMSAPATFSMQSFLKSKEVNAYVSTTNSIYVIVSIIVHAVLVAIYL